VGSTDSSEIDISSTRSVEVGYVGSDVFQGTVDVFQLLDNLATALTADDGDSIRDLIDDFDDAFDQLDVVRTEVGTNTKRALDMIDLTQTLQLELQNRLSSVEDIDIAAALTEFSLLQTQYDINLQLTSKTRTINLFSRM
jgi:flagellar hook-associated protein 3 FlgL